MIIFVQEIMKLDVEVEKQFKEFLKTKSDMKRTNSNWLERSTGEVSNYLTIMKYGKSVDEIIEEGNKRETEQKRIEAAYALERKIINRALIKKQAPSLIAQEMGLELTFVESVIAAFAYQ